MAAAAGVIVPAGGGTAPWSGLPFLFVTGYDDVMILERFAGVRRLRKPTDFRQVVRAAAVLCRKAGQQPPCQPDPA